MAIKNEIIDQLLKDQDPKQVFSSDGLLGEFKKALAERILNTEMDQHLAESTQEGDAAEKKGGNYRNGYSKKTVTTDSSQFELEVPRDRRGTFEPQLIAKYQRRFPGFDDKIISMYAVIRKYSIGRRFGYPDLIDNHCGMIDSWERPSGF